MRVGSTQAAKTVKTPHPTSLRSATFPAREEGIRMVMKDQCLSRAGMAAERETRRAQLNRVLDPTQDAPSSLSTET